MCLCVTCGSGLIQRDHSSAVCLSVTHFVSASFSRWHMCSMQHSCRDFRLFVLEHFVQLRCLTFHDVIQLILNLYVMFFTVLLHNLAGSQWNGIYYIFLIIMYVLWHEIGSYKTNTECLKCVWPLKLLSWPSLFCWMNFI